MTIKRAFWLAAMTVLSLTTHAQHFDWVKSYSGYEPSGRFWNYIVSSVTDSDGNLYVAGQFANGATIDGQDLLPFTPYGGDVNNPNTCILKFNPDGQLVWKKILHSNQSSGAQIYDLQLVGDSALYANVTIRPPMNNGEYLYLYDTLITKENVGMLLNADSLYYGGITTMISIISTDGDVLDNFVLHMAYKDADGRLITQDRLTNNTFDTVFIANQQFKPGQLCVDNHGNIYLGHLSTDQLWLFCDTCEYQLKEYNLSNGLISEVVIMVNGRQMFSHHLSSHPSSCNYRIMKFSPMFFNMVCCSYVFADVPELWSYTHSREFMYDSTSNSLYFISNFSLPSSPVNVPLSGDTNMFVRMNDIGQGVSIEFDTLLNPKKTIQVTHNSNGNRSSLNLSFDRLIHVKDSNYFYIIGSIARNGFGSSDLSYNNSQSIDIGLSDCNAFIFRINKDNHMLEHYNQAYSSNETCYISTYSHIGAVESNGRVFTVMGYKGNIQYLDNVIGVGNNIYGTVVYIWDSRCNAVGYIDLGENQSNMLLSSSLSVSDSNLYILLSSKGAINIQDTTLYPRGNSLSIVAQYTDSAFGSMYIPTSNAIIANNMPLTNNLKIYPNPTNNNVSFVIPESENVVECNIYSSMGGWDRIECLSNVLNLNEYKAGVYLIEVKTNKNVYRQKIIKL